MTRSPLGDARHLRLIFVYNRAFVRRICSTKVVLYLLRVTNVPQSTTPLLQVAQHLDWVCENESRVFFYIYLDISLDAI